MDLPIICFDMDGTLLDDRGLIHPADVALLSAADPPALFIPSTGRPLASVRCAFARSQLYLDRPIPLNMVLQNGALLMAQHEVRLAYEELDPAIQQDLLGMATRFPQVTFLFLSAGQIQVLWPNPFGVALAGSFDFGLHAMSSPRDCVPFSKLMCLSDSPAVLESIAAVVASWPVEAALSMPTILEITNYGIDKGRGVRRLLERIGKSDQPIYAAGDWGNDLPLFRIAAHSFAPATAPDAIKDAASHVIDVRPEGLLRPMLREAARGLS